MIRVVCGVLRRGDAVLATRRGPAMRHPGKWEFPGGKVESGESDADALVRELREELGLDVGVGEWIAVSHWGEIELHAYEVSGDGDIVLTEHDAFGWCGRARLLGIDWAEADIPLVEIVQRRLP